MPISARDVATALRQRLPGLPVKKLHKLLDYCQAHHVATFGRALFSDTISAWDIGPVVGGLWHSEKNEGITEGIAALDESQLNTIGYVVSRYGALTGLDLEHLTHGEMPWLRANEGRPAGGRASIEPTCIEEYFASPTVRELEDERGSLGQDEVEGWLKPADRRRATLKEDTREEIMARLAGRAGT